MKAAPLLLGLAAAAALTAEAEGCSYVQYNYAYRPVMADLVRDAHSITLAEVVEYEPLNGPSDLNQLGTYRYRFQVIETLSGPVTEMFELYGSDPFDLSTEEICEQTGRCGFDSVSRSNEHATWAAGGEPALWTYFYLIGLGSQDGYGGRTVQREEEPLDIDCPWLGRSHAIGDLVLVFRDADGNPLNGRGLNLQQITPLNDGWPEAVRYFLDHPEADRLPARAPELAFRVHRDASVVALRGCRFGLNYLDVSEFEIVRVVTGEAPRSGYSARFLLDPDAERPTCDGVTPYLAVSSGGLSFMAPLPVQGNMVDVSGVPWQFEVPERWISLSTIETWMDRSAHD